MAEITIQNFEDLIKQVNCYNQKITIYRGVTHEKYNLQPKVGRVKSKARDDTLIRLEKRILRLSTNQKISGNG